MNEVIFNTAIDIQGKGVGQTKPKRWAFETSNGGDERSSMHWENQKKKRHSENVRWRFG